VERVFRLPCTIGKPRDVSGLAVVTGGPEYAAAVGMLRYGQSTAPRGGGGAGLLDRLFGILRGGGGAGS
jgi:cell division ATPase FtsA